MDSTSIVLVVWGVFSLLTWCALALRKREPVEKSDVNSLFELLAVPGSVFLLFPIINMLNSGGLPLFISIWLILISLFILTIVYYPIQVTVDGSKNMINRLICIIYLSLQLIYYIFETIELVGISSIVLDKELFLMFGLLTYVIPAYIVTIAQIIHIVAPHHFFILTVDNAKFLKTMIYSFALNLISSYPISMGFISASSIIVSIISSPDDTIVFDTLRTFSFVSTYVMLIINFCTQYVTYKMRARDEYILSDNSFRDKLAYLQFDGYYIGFSYLSYIFNATFVFSICVFTLIIYYLDLIMFVFVYGLVLSVIVPYIAIFLLRKLHQLFYGYSFYGRGYKPFRSVQGAPYIDNVINPFWFYFSFYLSIPFGIYGFVNRGLIIPLLRLIFAPTYPRLGSKGVLDVGYRKIFKENTAIEMI